MELIDQKPGGVVFIINNEFDRFLLEQRNQNSKKDPWTFVFPGGKVESQDLNPVETVRREVREEFGLDILENDIEYLGKVPRLTDPDFLFIYYIKVVEIRTLIISESAGCAWFTLDEIKNMNLGYNQNERILPILLDFLNKNK